MRNGKAHIISARCIDCGECIRVCPHHAKLPQYDPLSAMDQFKYKVALPAPSLYGQFQNLDDADVVLNALLLMGFDDVFGVAAAAEMVSEHTRDWLAKHPDIRPVISSACPAVVRLICVRFPELIGHLLPLQAPMEVAAALARKQAAEKSGLDPSDIGIVFISPCAAKNTAVKSPLGQEKSNVDCVVAIKDIYPRLLPLMKIASKEHNAELCRAGRIGLSWSQSGGESAGTLLENYLAADGPENVIQILEGLEDEKFHDVDFVELNMCNGGCVGGVLTVENPYVAKARSKHIRKYLPVSVSHAAPDSLSTVMWDQEVSYIPVMKLSDNMGEAMRLMAAMNGIAEELPGLDCGSCGAPSCKALAEDIVRGTASEGDCIFRLREHMSNLARELSQFEGYIPPPFRASTEGKEEPTEEGDNT